MKLSNEIVLRPRFQLTSNTEVEDLLTLFDSMKTSDNNFIINRSDEHVFIRLQKKEQHFWSPQLHLEIFKTEDGINKIHGFFGPNPTIWTLFMFLHFVVAGIFIAFGIWAYSNWTLKEDYAIQLFVVLLTLLIWFILYFVGRIGRTKGKPQMHHLYNFMKSILGNHL